MEKAIICTSLFFTAYRHSCRTTSDKRSVWKVSPYGLPHSIADQVEALSKALST